MGKFLTVGMFSEAKATGAGARSKTDARSRRKAPTEGLITAKITQNAIDAIDAKTSNSARKPAICQPLFSGWQSSSRTFHRQRTWHRVSWTASRNERHSVEARRIRHQFSAHHKPTLESIRRLLHKVCQRWIGATNLSSLGVGRKLLVRKTLRKRALKSGAQIREGGMSLRPSITEMNLIGRGKIEFGGHP